MLVIVRGGGDIATGIIWSLYTSGFKVLVLEVEKPSAIRRSVSFSECVYKNTQTVEGIKSRLVKTKHEIERCWNNKEIPVVIDSVGNWIKKLSPQIVVDAILAKKNIGTSKNMAEITIGLGPGFIAGKDVDIVIETMRGHNLGRIIFSGEALKNTGVPGEISGISKERVIYSDISGVFNGTREIGDKVKKSEVIGTIGDRPVLAEISGVLRGIIPTGYNVKGKFKIADIDPRESELENCFCISDKARSLGGAVVIAIMSELKKRGELNGF